MELKYEMSSSYTGMSNISLLLFTFLEKAYSILALNFSDLASFSFIFASFACLISLFARLWLAFKAF